MTSIRPFMASDLLSLDIQPGQRDEAGGMSTAQLIAGPAWTALNAGGAVIGCGGFAPVYPGHFFAWAHLAVGKRHALLAITRHAHWWMDGARWRRLTGYARADWPEAHRWMVALGFRAEGLLLAFGPQGEDFMVYGRCNREW
jgi:hypothetical protein